MAEFKTERVYFTVIGQGSLDVEYIDGEETPEEAFRAAYPDNISVSLRRLMQRTDDMDYVITCATEPYPPVQPGSVRPHLWMGPTDVETPREIRCMDCGLVTDPAFKSRYDEEGCSFEMDDYFPPELTSGRKVKMGVEVQPVVCERCGTVELDGRCRCG